MDKAKIVALRSEAAVAGDLEMVAICDRAIDGDEAVLTRCAQVLRDAAVMALD